MKKVTKKSLDELARIMPALSEEEQRSYVGGTWYFDVSGAFLEQVGTGNDVRIMWMSEYQDFLNQNPRCSSLTQYFSEQESQIRANNPSYTPYSSYDYDYIMSRNMGFSSDIKVPFCITNGLTFADMTPYEQARLKERYPNLDFGTPPDIVYPPTGSVAG